MKLSRVVADRLGLSENESEQIFRFFNDQRINDLLSFLVEKNIEGGFFSKSDSQRILERHLFESMVYVVASLPFVSRETEVLDVGSGPGLPGALFACLSEPRPVALLDSSKRRLSFLEQEDLFGATRVKYLYARAEELSGRFRAIVSRAFLPFPYSILAIHHLQKTGDHYLPFVASVPDLDWKSFVYSHGYSITDVIELPILKGLGKRILIVLEKDRQIHGGRPYRWKFIKDQIQ